jgi:uncharacterized protein DUF6994
MPAESVGPCTSAQQKCANLRVLFGDFRGYVEFFLLRDLVTEDWSAVKFFMPFEDFNTSPLPKSLEAYRAYR